MSSIDYRIIKYPRTPHIEGSRLQPGDEDLSQVPFSAIAGKHLVVEEKIDGANSAISFDPQGNLLLQSRGHYLTGGYRERHYNLFKQWANIHYDMLWKLLGCRYVMYGEWMYAKHSIYYDALPHYFMEFDILDRETDRFLDTKTRHEMTDGLPICHVPVLGEGEYTKREDLMRHLGNSRFITDAHLDNLRIAAQRRYPARKDRDKLDDLIDRRDRAVAGIPPVENERKKRNGNHRNTRAYKHTAQHCTKRAFPPSPAYTAAHRAPERIDSPILFRNKRLRI